MQWRRTKSHSGTMIRCGPEVVHRRLSSRSGYSLSISLAMARCAAKSRSPPVSPEIESESGGRESSFPRCALPNQLCPTQTSTTTLTTWYLPLSDEPNSPVLRFNPQRLEVARKRRGWTKSRLAHEAGISPRMVTAYERDGKRPTTATLERVANCLDFPRGFFEADSMDEVPPFGTSFRALSRLTAKESGQARAAGTIAIALAAWIDERFRLPSPDIPSYPGVDSETASLALRQHWGIGERPVRHMIRLVEANGVRVFSLPHECQSVDAFSFKLGHVPFIFLNTRKSVEHTRMDIAHELGHLVLHWEQKLQGRNEEREAAQFASALLMPRDSVCAHSPRNGNVAQIITAKKRWRVSAAALTYRMHEVGMLSDWRYRTTFAHLSRRGFRTSEPDPLEPETSSVLDQVFRVLREEGTSGRDVAAALMIPPDELNNLTFGPVLAPRESPSPVGGKKPPSEEQRRKIGRTLRPV